MNPSYDRMRRLECIQDTFTTTPCSGTVSQILLALIKVVPIGAHMSLHHCAKTASWSERVRAWARAICIALASTVVCAVGVAGDVKAQTSNFSVSQPRTVTVLDKQAWRFIQDDNLTDAAALSSDASNPRERLDFAAPDACQRG